MNDSSKYELYLITKELQTISNTLDDIAEVINNYSNNIGNDVCADCVTRVADKYTIARRKLDNLDTKATSEIITSSASAFSNV